MAIGNNLTLGGKLNVTDAGGFFTSGSYTLFTYGGVLTYNGLTIGTTPSNTNCTIDTSTAGLVKLTVSGFAPPPTRLFKIVSITRSVNDIVIKWTAASAGTNIVQAENGNYNTNNFADLSAPFVVSTGVTNSFTYTAGQPTLRHASTASVPCSPSDRQPSKRDIFSRFLSNMANFEPF